MISGFVIFLIFIMLFFILLFSGWPIAFSLAAATIVSYIFISGGSVLGNFAVLTYNTMFNYNLLALPIFILMGEILIYGGISSGLYDALSPLMERFRGGLIYTTILANLILGACCGSSVAATTSMSAVAIPELSKRGYEKGIIYGSLASAGCLSTLIPPSVGMILFCSVTTVSLGQLFIAGIIPGIILALFFSIISYFWMIINPKIVPKVTTENINIFKAILLTFKKLWSIALLIVIVLGVIYFGIGTPTEAGCYGVIGALIIALSNKKMNLEKIKFIFNDTGRISASLLTIIAMASVYGFALNALGLKDVVVNFLLSIPGSPILKMLFIWFIFLIMGMFIDSAGVIVITTPIFLPIAVSLGYDPLWYGIFTILAVDIGNITPPVGLTLFAVQAVSKDKLEIISRGCLPYWVAFFLASTMIIFFPILATWLPSLGF